MASCWRRIYVFLLDKNRCCLVGEEYMAMEDVFLLEKNTFLFLFLFLCCCLKLFKCALRLAAGAFFCWKMTFSGKMIFLILWKNYFLSKIVKNTTFELLDHHHELNQKKLILLDFFMLRIDSTMLKLWSIPRFCFVYMLTIFDSLYFF